MILYLTDGRVRSPISHHDVGVKINVVQLHWSQTHGHRSAHFTANALWSTWTSTAEVTGNATFQEITMEMFTARLKIRNKMNVNL